ncbi:hypothetical protein ACNOYE_34860 [Nannocystaceae bacterium ST9]
MGAQVESLIDRLRVWLGGPRAFVLVGLLALLLGLPTLDAGLIGDDVAHHAFLRRALAGEVGGRWWDMFVLVDGDPSHTIGLRTAGRMPWWVDPDLRIAFFRPLSVATHLFDHWAWPESILAMHLHSVLWYVLACVLATALGQRLASSPGVGGLAGLAWCVMVSHASAVGWLAHRNGLVATVGGFACLLAYDRWRRDGWRPGAVLAPLALLAGLLGAELAICTFGGLIAYALLLDHGKPSRRWLALLPCLAVVVFWRVGYDALGYGSHGSAAYLDPVEDPLGFLAAVPGRLGWLAALSFAPPLVVGMSRPLWVVLTIGFACALIGFVIARRHTDEGRRAGAALLATALGLVPLVASVPGERVLLLTSFGVALALAELIGMWSRAASIGLRAIAGLVALVHLGAAAIVFSFGSREFDQLGFDGELAPRGLELPNEGIARKGLVIVYARDHMTASHLPLARIGHGLAAPNFTWILHTGPDEPEVIRIDERTLELHDVQGWLREPFAAYYRNVWTRPFEVGDEVRTVDFTAHVLEVERGAPTRVRFRFRAPIAHPSFVFARWTGVDFELWTPDG